MTWSLSIKAERAADSRFRTTSRLCISAFQPGERSRIDATCLSDGVDREPLCFAPEADPSTERSTRFCRAPSEEHIDRWEVADPGLAPTLLPVDERPEADAKFVSDLALLEATPLSGSHQVLTERGWRIPTRRMRRNVYRQRHVANWQ